MTGSPEHTHNSTSEIEDEENDLSRTEKQLVKAQKSEKKLNLNNNNNNADEVLSSFTVPPTNHQSAVNHAIAAQLFLQSPFMPPTSQWFYNQLYSNYQDFPWLRNTFSSAHNLCANITRDTSLLENNRLTLAKHRAGFTMNNVEDVTGEQDTHVTRSDVTSSKLSPNAEDFHNSDDSEVNIKQSKSEVTMNNQISKNSDVWRPY